jgi:hypothetical protein
MTVDFGLLCADIAHVGTTDLSFFQNKKLFQTIKYGLNHIHFEPIDFAAILFDNTPGDIWHLYGSLTNPQKHMENFLFAQPHNTF